MPYIEPGDTVQFNNYGNPVTGYVLQRTLTGIQVLTDNYIASGNEEREQNFGVNEEIIQLQGKVTRIKKDVEGVLVEVEDVAQELYAGMSILAGQVVLKVDASGNVAAVELGADPSQGTNIKIKADNIQLEGLVTANGYFKILPDGSMEAVNGKFSGTLTGSSFIGGYISGTQITSSGNGVLVIDGAEINGYNSNGESILWITANGSIHTSTITAKDMHCSRINGYTPVHAGNIGVQSVAFATNAGYATNAGSVDTATYAQLAGYATNANRATNADNADRLGSTVYISENGNFRPFSDGFSSCGTSLGRWSSVWAANGTIQTSDEREKTDIMPLENDERFLKFAKMIVPYTYKMIKGTSGRKHIGFIAQRIEEAMKVCGISSVEFAGFIKEPVYAKKLKDQNGNELPEYDTTSEIIDYTYHLRYDEFIPLIFLWLRHLNEYVEKC